MMLMLRGMLRGVGDGVDNACIIFHLMVGGIASHLKLLSV